MECCAPCDPSPEKNLSRCTGTPQKFCAKIGFERSHMIGVAFRIFVVFAFEEQRKQIRAMQIRLARMADTLVQVAGNEPQDHLLLEFNEA